MARRKTVFWRRGAALAASVLAAGMLLSGCGEREPVTAEGLIQGIEIIDPEKYSDISVAVSVSTGGEDASGMQMGMCVEGDAKIRHVYDTAVRIFSGDETMDIGMEGWIDQENGVAYTVLDQSGFQSGWTKAGIEESGGIGELAGTADSVGDLWEGCTFELGTDEASGGYSVEWDVDPDSMADVLGAVGEEASGSDFGSMSGTAVFDKKSKELKSVRVDAQSTDGGEFLLYIEFRTVNGDKALSIPDDVVNGASESEAMLDGLEPVVSEHGWYTYDDGSDDYIDPIATRTHEALDGQGWVLASHGDAFSQMAVQYYPDEGWVGAMDLQHATTDEYPDMGADTYEAQAEWYAENCGEENLVSGSDTYALYVVDDESLYYVSLVDKDTVLAVEVFLESGSGDRDALLANLDGMLSMAGLPEREG